MNDFKFNVLAGIHNLGLIDKAERLVNNFLDNDDFVYVQNPDGSYLKLQQGVKFIAVTGLGIEIEK
jgi:hypothetical protein